MTGTFTQAFVRNFLGNSPMWYKQAILAFLVINPILLVVAGPVVTGWILIFFYHPGNLAVVDFDDDAILVSHKTKSIRAVGSFLHRGRNFSLAKACNFSDQGLCIHITSPSIEF